MAINFNANSTLNLKPIKLADLNEEVSGLLIDGEVTIAAFQTVRDQLVFTNKRVISIDVQGLSGTRVAYSSLPYSRIQYFTIQTVGLNEIVPDSELSLTFTNGFTARFEFKGDVDIGRIGRLLSKFVLD